MTQKWCSAEKGRILSMSLELWTLVNKLDDEDKLSPEQKVEFDNMWEYAKGYTDEYVSSMGG